jgi:hypothetical protein
MSSGACLLPTKASSRSRKYNRSSLRWRSSRCQHWWGKDATSRCGSLQASSASCHCRTQVRSFVRLRLSPSSTCRGAHLSRCAVRHHHCQDRRWPALGHPPPSEALLALRFLHLSCSRFTPPLPGNVPHSLPRLAVWSCVTHLSPRPRRRLLCDHPRPARAVTRMYDTDVLIDAKRLFEAYGDGCA